MGAATTIALGIISNFATDLIRWASGEQVVPLNEAIDSTVDSFPQLEGLNSTLREWLRSVGVQDALRRVIEGQVAASEFPVERLASALIVDAGFYLPEHSEATATKVISVFVAKVRSAYLTNSSLAVLHVANRQEALYTSLQAAIESAGGLKPALQTHFDQALAQLDASNYPAAKTLFESLLTEIQNSSLRDRSLERRIHASLGQAQANLGERDSAISHYEKAIELDDDPVRAAVNSAVVSLIEQKPDEALHKLTTVVSAEASSVPFEYNAAKIEALLGVKRNKEALDTARTLNFPGKEALQLELSGRAYRECGMLDDAEKSFRNAISINPSRPELQYCLAEVLFSPVVDYRNQHPGLPIQADMQAKLDDAGSALQRAAGGFAQQGRTRAAGEVESALAVVRNLQGRFPDSIQLLERITKSEHATANDWRLLGFAYLSTNQSGKAADALRHSLALDADQMTEYLYAQALIMDGRADDALHYAESKATEPITPDNAKWHVTKANALGSKRQFSKAREVLTAVLTADPTNAEVLLTLAELYDATGDDAEAANAYEQALKNASGPQETRVRYEFGGFAARKRNHKRAIELWQPLVQKDKPSTLLDSYLCALYNTGSFAEVVEIADQIAKSREKASEACADVIAAAYQRLDDLTQAGKWLEYLCDNYGNKPEFIIRLSNIKFRLGKRDEALELLNASKSRLNQADDLMGYANAYSMLGIHSDAIELGRRAILSAKDDPNIAMGYVGVFLAAGDEFEKTSEQISVFQETLSTFKERFPTSPHLQRFTIDPERPLDAIRDTLVRMEQQTRDVVKFYRENRMPLRMFAKLLGRDLYETWVQVIADPDLVLLSAAGTEEEQQECQHLLATRTGFIIEPVCLFTFSYLGLLEKLRALGDLYIAGKTLDELHHIHGQRNVLLKHQKGTMGMMNGQFFMHEVTSEEVEKVNAALNTATGWSEANLTVAGLREPLTEGDEKLSEPLGEANVATLLVAKQKGYVLLTDDKTLGDLGAQNYGISFVNSQAVLLYLLNKGLLSQAEYDTAVVKLVQAGYIFTRVDERQLYQVIVEEQFQITPRLKRVFRALEPALIVLAPACFAVAGLLRRIYLEPIPDEMRNLLAFYMLDALATNHPKIEIQRLVRAFLRQQMGPILVLQLKSLEELLDKW